MHPDTTTGLQVGVNHLRRQLGDHFSIHREPRLEGLFVGDVAVDRDTSLGVDLVLEAIEGGVRATGIVTAPWKGVCRRCLDPVSGATTAEVDETYAVSHVDGETYPLVGGDVVDLEPLIREVVLLSLPLAPLCREDCPGPAPDLFPLVVETDDAADGGGRDRPRDPRWAALDQLRES